MTTVPAVESPLLHMVRRTPTDYWNDSCAVAELEYAVERGATGATSNPVIVGEVMKKEKDHWVPRVRQMAAENPTWSEVELTWALIEEMGVRGAGILAPVFEAHDGRKDLADAMLHASPDHGRGPATPPIRLRRNRVNRPLQHRPGSFATAASSIAEERYEVPMRQSSAKLPR